MKNCGLGGTRIARQKEKYECAQCDFDFVGMVQDTDKDYDFVFVFGETNDFGHAFIVKKIC